MKKNSIIIVLLLSILLIESIGYAATMSTLSVAATVISKNECKFNSKTSALNFGTLDPANPVDVNVTTSITFKCGGSNPNATFSITDDGGLYETGPNGYRMRHTTLASEYLPYSLTLNPKSGTVPKNTDQTLTVSGTVKGTDYQNVSSGSYSDTVVISIEP